MDADKNGVRMFVYKIINAINSRVYVGLTTCSLEKRWREHRSAANMGVAKPLYRAMRLHGIKNFSIHLLYTATSFDDLRQAELKFIEELKAHTLDGGYNLTDHGARYGAPNSHKGEQQYNSKLTEEVVAFIRDPAHWDKDNQDLLFLVNEKFNLAVKRDTVRDARRGDSWKHLNNTHPPVKLGRGRKVKPMSGEHRAIVVKTLAENREKAIKKSAEMRLGKRGKNARLTEDTVRSIFFHNASLNKTAKHFGVSKPTVMRIKQRQTHTYLTKDL